MKQAIKRIVEKSNRKLQEVLSRMQIEQSTGAGMKIIHHIIDDDVRRPASPPVLTVSCPSRQKPLAFQVCLHGEVIVCSLSSH